MSVVDRASKPQTHSLDNRRRFAASHWLARLLSPDVIAPLLVGGLVLILWEVGVRVTNTPPYLLPGPLLVGQTLIQEWSVLFPSLLITFKITLVAFIAAVISDAGLARQRHERDGDEPSLAAFR
ncbi:hypothetical protein [Leptolyngbya sp. 7M]|uniref:hypothetical protein n=1 Tax=Leptolyngbya sp. 7M TaxID=2812896 RepID=UPI001B8BD922|nr:hypothetical protein [Leptolyngbya sp. 7M]QYO64697.1 hypothetical protein JVX88_34665 [Leptolyngbya sp. 7M]